MSSMISVASILYFFLSTSFWEQHHKIERIFCSPRDKICLASMPFITIFISALWGPWVVVLLNKSFFWFWANSLYSSLSLSHPEKNSMLTLFRFSVIAQGFSLLKMLFSSNSDSSKKAILFISRSPPSSETFWFQASILSMSPFLRELFLCFNDL